MVVLTSECPKSPCTNFLKIGLSGIAKRYGYKNVQEFYRYHKSHSAYIAYREKEAAWDKDYGSDNQKRDKESVLERLGNLPKKAADYQQQRMVKNKDRGECFAKTDKIFSSCCEE